MPYFENEDDYAPTNSTRTRHYGPTPGCNLVSKQVHAPILTDKEQTELGSSHKSSSPKHGFSQSYFQQEITEVTIEYEPSPISPLGPGSPRSTTLYEHSGNEIEIELEELHVPLPPAAARSTDRLVLPPPPGVAAATSINLRGTESNAHREAKYTKSRTTEILDSKQLSLRWPFMVFILAVISGFFAFLEYGVNDLPPVHYSMIPFNPPRPDKAIPEPRPPKSNYPEPPTLTSTYCGWSAPKWYLWNFSQGSCDDFFCDDWDMPAWCEPQNFDGRALYCLKERLSEEIDMFTTDDASWCPCEGPQGTFVNHGLKGPIWDERAGSWDSGCRSAMSAIVSFNEYKTKYQWITTTNYLGYETSTTVPQSSTLKTGFWAFPKTGSDGAIMMPLVVRTAGLEKQNVFGDPVGSLETGTFPDGFAGLYDRNTAGMNPCSISNMFSGVLHNYDGFPCPDAQVGVFHTVWWTLPLSRPTTPVKSPSSVYAGTTTSWTSSVDIITSTAQLMSSAPTLPLCTSCASESSSQLAHSQVVGTIIPTSTEPVTLKTTSRSPSSGVTISSEPGASSLPERPSSNTPMNSPEKERQLSTLSPPQSLNDETEDTPSPLGSSTSPLSLVSSATQSAILLVGVDQLTPGSPSSVKAISETQSPRPDAAPSPVLPGSPPPFHTPGSSILSGTPRSLPPCQTSSILQPGKWHTPDPEQVSRAHDDPSSGTLSTLHGPPTEMPGGPIDPSSQGRFFNLRSEADYLMASVVPVLLATLLAIPIQVFVTNINSMLPFRALGHYPAGVTAQDSLCLSRNPAFLNPLLIASRFLYGFSYPLPLLGFILSTLSTVLIPISSEVIRLEFTTKCSRGDGGLNLHSNPLMGVEICAFGIRKSGPLMRTAEAMLIAMAFLTIGIGYLLMRWRTGVPSEPSPEPWSIASLATLLSAKGSELASLLRQVATWNTDTEKRVGVSIANRIEEILADRRFQLGFIYSLDQGETRGSYGIKTTEIRIKEDNAPITPKTRPPPTRKPQSRTSRWTPTIWQKLSMDGTNLDLTVRTSTLVFTIGLLALILYYENIVSPDTGFERFMNSQSFGVRILFTAFGSVISAFWGYYFLYTSELQIHARLAASAGSGGLVPESSILLSPPSTPFISIYRSAKATTQGIPAAARRSKNRRATKSNSPDRDWTSFNVALATILSKFTPILLSNIPFSDTVTWKIHEACTWLSVAFLGYMVLVLGWTFVTAGTLPSLINHKRYSRVGPSEGLRIGRLGSPAGGIKLPQPVVGSDKRMEVCECVVGECSRQGRLADAMRGDRTTHKADEGQRLESGRTGAKDLLVSLDTIAGVIYYLCDSKMLKDFEGLANGKPVVDKDKRDRMTIDMGRRYNFGEIKGAFTGEKRLGVDYIDHQQHGISDSAA